MKKLVLTALISGLASGAIFAQDAKKLTVPINKVTVEGELAPVGEVVITESSYGLVFTANLTDLTAGLHGFHIHENASCDAQEKGGEMVAGGAAGGHWDPHNTGRHGHPWQDDVHLGDLPALYVDENGESNVSVLAPRLKSLDEIKGHALMIHEGGDNHSDEPKPLGGGGGRMACGVIE